MEKRGQLTIFIIIGIVILVILGVVFFVIYVPSAPQVAPEDFSDVQKYVDACVDQTLKDAVVWYGGTRFSGNDYILNLTSYIESNLVYCTKFTEDFPTLEVTTKDVGPVTVSLNPDNTLISAVVIYPITVKKGSLIKTLERFYAEIPLINNFCLPVDVEPGTCVAKTSKTFSSENNGLTTTWEITAGEDLTIKGDNAYCPVCP